MGRQITDIKWYFHNFGPYVDDVIEVVQSDPRFEVVHSRNYYGEGKLEIRSSGRQASDSALDAQELSILDKIISETSSMYWNSFIKHVYATDPIQQSDRYQQLDLVGFAQESAQA